jgi:hypothetical protein
VFRAAGYRTIGLDIRRGDGNCDAFIEADLERLCVEEQYRRDTENRLAKEVAGDELRALINNAAVQILGRSDELTAATWQRTRVNVLAPSFRRRCLQLEAAHGSA